MHINNDFQKNSNISHVLETIWRDSEISRIDIAKKLNIYRSTVSNIIATLLQNKVICEGQVGESNENGGRKPVFLTINPDFGCIVGLEIQADFYKVAVMSFDRRLLFTKTGETPFSDKLCDKGAGEGWDFGQLFIQIVDEIKSQIEDDIKKLGLPVLGVSIGIPGIVDIDNGIIIYSEPFKLKEFDYKKELGEKYNLPLIFENDARCCGWIHCAEKGLDKEDFLCVFTRNHEDKGIGVGLSIALGGHIITGRKHSAGEYISSSWNGTNGLQTGLPYAVISTINRFDESYRLWVKDLFSTLTTAVGLLRPDALYFHGQSDARKDFILKVIGEDVPQFSAILKECGTAFEIMDENPYEIAGGAALMFIQKLFEIPSLEDAQASHITWDEIFAIQSKVS